MVPATVVRSKARKALGEGARSRAESMKLECAGRRGFGALSIDAIVRLKVGQEIRGRRQKQAHTQNLGQEVQLDGGQFHNALGRLPELLYIGYRAHFPQFRLGVFNALPQLPQAGIG